MTDQDYQEFTEEWNKQVEIVYRQLWDNIFNPNDSQ